VEEIGRESMRQLVAGMGIPRLHLPCPNATPSAPVGGKSAGHSAN
jgi:hypothetical protein